MHSQDRSDFFNFTLESLQNEFYERFQRKYTANQLFDWIYKKFETNPDLMTNIPKKIRDEIKMLYNFEIMKPCKILESMDGSKKFLFTLHDNNKIESVLMPHENRWTLCVSSQVGCGMGCRFCKTATMGFIRNLTTSEIIQQIMSVCINYQKPNNIVFMGMGEPLANYNNVAQSLKILTEPKGLNYSWRSITVSTVGLIPKIKRFFLDQLPAQLAISLNAPNQKIRSDLMPISSNFKFEQIIETIKNVRLKKRQKIFLEYILIDALTSEENHLNQLAKSLKSVKHRVKINLIPFNEFPDSNFKRPSVEKIENWRKQLQKNGFTATIRWSKGVDIFGGCGQLATSQI